MQHGALLPATPLWATFLDQVNGTMPLPMLLAQLQQQGDDIASLFAVTFSHGTFHPDALERAAHIVRDRHHLDHALVSSAAHARLTLRILSALPIVAFTVSASVSSSMRALCTSTAFVFIIFVGVLLNRAGAWWVSLLIRRATQMNTLAQSIALMESLSVSVQSGHTLAECCMLWQHVNDLGAQVVQLVRDGASLSDALRPMLTTNNPFDALVANTLLSAQHDGLPIRSTATLLASEARKVLRAEVDTGIRQLPTRLSLPLVLCVLPSFALLVITPLLITQLSRFGSFLPSSLS
jgi:tight adherence protein B